MRARLKAFFIKYIPLWGFSLPALWLIFFLAMPLVILAVISFAESVIGIPPYTPLWSWVSQGVLSVKISFLNYAFILGEKLYAWAYWQSFALGFATTSICLVIAYPVGYALLHIEKKWRFACLVFMMLPFWISLLVRVYAWIGLLSPQGLLSELFIVLGFLAPGEGILGSYGAVLLGMVYTYLPFMILPVYTALEKLDFALMEAAFDLGARPLRVFFQVVFPLSRKGALTGAILVFIPVVGEYAIPELLGGQKTLMIGQLIWNEFFYNRDWPLASALAMCMLITLVPPIMILARMQKSSR